MATCAWDGCRKTIARITTADESAPGGVVYEWEDEDGNHLCGHAQDGHGVHWPALLTVVEVLPAILDAESRRGQCYYAQDGQYASGYRCMSYLAQYRVGDRVVCESHLEWAITDTTRLRNL